MGTKETEKDMSPDETKDFMKRVIEAMSVLMPSVLTEGDLAVLDPVEVPGSHATGGGGDDAASAGDPYDEIQRAIDKYTKKGGTGGARKGKK